MPIRDSVEVRLTNWRRYDITGRLVVAGPERVISISIAPLANQLVHLMSCLDGGEIGYAVVEGAGEVRKRVSIQCTRRLRSDSDPTAQLLAMLGTIVDQFAASDEP